MPKTVVYVRVARPRAGFLSPTSSAFLLAQEAALWHHLVRCRDLGTPIDWDLLLSRFDTSVEALQQISYWLYEKELEELRRGVKRHRRRSSTDKSRETTPAAPPPAAAAAPARVFANPAGTPRQLLPTATVLATTVRIKHDDALPRPEHYLRQERFVGRRSRPHTPPPTIDQALQSLYALYLDDRQHGGSPHSSTSDMLFDPTLLGARPPAPPPRRPSSSDVSAASLSKSALEKALLERGL